MTRYDSYKLQHETPSSLDGSSSAKSFTGKVCFCSQTAKGNVLHQFQKLYMDAHMRKVAYKLGDTKLFAKLSERVMVAVEAVHNSNCFKKLYNRYRSHNKWKSSERNNLEMIQGKFTRKRHESFPTTKTN